MGWETRGGRSYYYQKERDGGRVRSVYVGANRTASLVAQLDTIRRDEAVHNRTLERFRREELAAVDREIDLLGEIVKQFTSAALLVNGYHQHKREWRRKRR